MNESVNNKSIENALRELSQKHNIPKEVIDKISQNSELIEKTIRTLSASELINANKEVEK